jgi:hypothetical protein
MPVITWFASFIFLGLSLSIGLLVYLLMSKKKKDDEEEELPPELQNIVKKKDEKSTVEDLERQYKKKG